MDEFQVAFLEKLGDVTAGAILKISDVAANDVGKLAKIPVLPFHSRVFPLTKRPPNRGQA
jgi:hypothetical protein